MKRLIALSLTFIAIGCNHDSKAIEKSEIFKDQTKMYEGDKYVVFNLKHATDTTSIDGIDWKKENLTSEFTLKGKNNLRYSININNDSIARLSRFDGEKFIFQENISITDWTISRTENNTIISEFKIIDFNKDGNEDLVCWVGTNVNGNVWTVIYLNIPEKKKLEKLYSADGTDIWDAPAYDSKTKIISCELVSGAYGFNSTYTHKLVNYIAIPLERENRNYTSVNAETGEGAIIETFVGEKGKWKLQNRQEQ